MKYSTRNNGFVTLVSVLVVGAVGIVIAIALLLLGLSASRTSFVLEQSTQARVLADNCAEEALERVRETPAFTGSGNLTFNSGTCSYTVTSGGGESRTVRASSTVNLAERKITVSIDQIMPKIRVSSWQEVAE